MNRQDNSKAQSDGKDADRNAHGNDAKPSQDGDLDYTRCSSMPIFPASVWRSDSTEQASRMLSGEGYSYQREKHPNADALAVQIAKLHQTQSSVITASGMSAISAGVLSFLQAGDHLLISDQLYGRTTLLMKEELPRLGIETELVDVCDLEKVQSAIRPNTRMLVAETISNPLLKTTDIRGLSKIAHSAGALLMIDNTFATPYICRPAVLGADLVVESLSKFINGHSDLMLGAICGSENFDRVAKTVATWGLNSAPFDCWLTHRGLMTLNVRIQQACKTAQMVAQFCQKHPNVRSVHHPGLKDNGEWGFDNLSERALFESGILFENSVRADEISRSLELENNLTPTAGLGTAANPDADSSVPLNELASQGHATGHMATGHMVTVQVAGGVDSVNRFISTVSEIPFFPSLGDICTSLSHPRSTSHRGLNDHEGNVLGITDDLIRFSIGIEEPHEVIGWIQNGLNALD